jgi:hypothetical protein
MYLSLYVPALYYVDRIGATLRDAFGVPYSQGFFVVMVLAMWGIATRIYLMSALSFDHPDLPAKFRKLFPALWLLDSIWAASPLFLDNIHLGVAVVFVALLAYVPFSQKTLMENLPGDNPRSS